MKTRRVIKRGKIKKKLLKLKRESKLKVI